MSIDYDQRVRAALRDLAEAVPVAPPSAAALRARAEPGPARRGARWLVPALAAAAVVALVAATALVPSWFPPSPSPDPAGLGEPAVLPEHFAGPSWRTASAAHSPPGPAIAVFAPVDPWPPVLLVVGVDGRSYRQLDRGALSGLSHGREFGATGPVLSPDGTRLAGDGGYVIDLTGDGGSDWYRVLDRDTRDSWSGAPLLAWSPDGRRLAYQVRNGIVLLDPATGARRRLDIGISDQQLAFSPDGRSFAVPMTTGEDADPGRVAVFDLAGDRLRELDLPPAHRLAGRGTAWSPDGALLVTYGPGAGGAGFAFLDATGSGAEVPAPIRWPGAEPGQDLLPQAELLGWRSPHTMLIGQLADDHGPTRIMAVPVDGGEPRVVSQLPDDAERRVQSLHLASGLLAEAEFRDPGPPRHGPVPIGVRIAVAVMAGGLLLLLTLLAWRRMRHRRS